MFFSERLGSEFDARTKLCRSNKKGPSGGSGARDEDKLEPVRRKLGKNMQHLIYYHLLSLLRGNLASPLNSLPPLVGL